MEAVSPFYNPHILSVLKSFENAASQSLKGPLRVVSTLQLSTTEMADYLKSLKSFPVKTSDTKSVYVSSKLAPLFFVMDTHAGKQCETILESENIAGFLVGGEKRLCLPQILNTVLSSFSMEQVHEGCSELHIFFSRCNAEQLRLLKDATVLPASAQSCGLITKTDAERLCNKLLHSQPELCRQEPPTANSFKVYHECFGKCKGIFSPELYINQDSLCIECYECCGMFSPSRFVCHSHQNCETRTCHWGFDSENWRSYLLLAKDQDFQELLIKQLSDMKDKFDPKCKLKRKQSSSEDNVANKRNKIISPLISPTLKLHPKFRKMNLPMSLEQGPPKLLNPERVVRFEEHKRYGRDFVPNVSLAPLPLGKRCVDDRSDYCDDFDLSSSSESGSESSAPSTPRQNHDAMDFLSKDDDELTLLHQALNGEVGASQHEKDNFVKNFLELRESSKVQLQNLIKTNADLSKEATNLRSAKKQKVEELMESHREQRKEIHRLKLEKQVWTHEMADDKQRLMHEMDNIRSNHMREMSKVKSGYKKQTELLRKRVNQFEQVFAQMNQEILYLRGEMKKQGKDVPDIQYRIASPTSSHTQTSSSSSNSEDLPSAIEDTDTCDSL